MVQGDVTFLYLKTLVAAHHLGAFKLVTKSLSFL